MAVLLSVPAPPPTSPTPTPSNDNQDSWGMGWTRAFQDGEGYRGVTFTPMLVFRCTTFCVKCTYKCYLAKHKKNNI